MILVTQLFSKVENVFAPRENEMPAFSNFSAGLKSAFEIKSAVLISAEFGRYLLSSAIKFNSSVSFFITRWNNTLNNGSTFIYMFQTLLTVIKR